MCKCVTASLCVPRVHSCIRGQMRASGCEPPNKEVLTKLGSLRVDL